MLLDIFRHPNSLLHKMGEMHLEAPIRIKIIERALQFAAFKHNYITASAATPKEILKVHDKALFQRMKSSQSKGGDIFTEDTIANKFTYQAALTAVGGSIQTAMNLKTNHSFAMLRPPGHHATHDQAMGFCFFNNISIAAKHLLDNRSRRIAILDIDNHHGNGTQNLFYSSPDVLYTSLHAAPNIAFPGTGYISEIGKGDGEGKTVNIPLPFQTNDEDFLYAFDSIIEPIVSQFKPDTILVSLGFDTLLHDPYGALGMSPDGFTELGHRIGKLNQLLTNNKVGAFLEGGYKYNDLGNAALNFFYAMLNHGEFTKSGVSPSKRIQEIIHSVRSTHSNYWYTI